MLKASDININTDFLGGSVLLFNKPLQWSSFDVVKKVRNIIKSGKKIGKIKVGHAGTLDPLADGLLIVCTGKFTKRVEEIQGQKKVYTGEITIGSTTPSYDKETEIDETFETSHITENLIYSSCKKFEGKIMQKPPIFSALKKDGKRLYQYAREGTTVEIKEREVEIEYFKITKIDIPKIEFEVKCSKGTYIRSLAFDFGKEIKSGAHLSSLRREQIGNYKIKNAISIEQFREKILS
ncbi:MAG: tRNA pseudouridine(55) synthase TruB [Flavobacteriales bacterium]|jgi:tRNA pseudouridine55 synthase|nr:tRNA pseudouridine(55) synthase TruB [Flavobacteriales bacterium]MBT6013650.1 tRNA pseudouridine(55) synthase TruB [Flavobacteriales bacterium]MBT7480792.1 tRNA pseudouridine(55) synthase TruB [Flavobacteriales bacterium]